MFKKYLSQYMEKNSKWIMPLIMCIIVGIVAGILAYSFASSEIKNVVQDSMRSALDLSKSDLYIRNSIILNGIKSNLGLVAILAVMALMLFGRYLIYITYILKGITMGIYICTVFSIFGLWWGLLVTLILFVLVNLVYIPGITYIGVSLLNFQENMLDMKKDHTTLPLFIKSGINLAVGFGVIFSSIIIEQLGTNIVLKIYERL